MKSDRQTKIVRSESYNWVEHLNGLTIGEALVELSAYFDRVEKEAEELGYTFRLKQEWVDYDAVDTFVEVTRLENDEEYKLRMDKAAKRAASLQKRKEAMAAAKKSAAEEALRKQAEQEQAERDLYEVLRAKYGDVDTKRT